MKTLHLTEIGSPAAVTNGRVLLPVGEDRIADLTAPQARRLAYALLLAAEEAQAAKR